MELRLVDWKIKLSHVCLIVFTIICVVACSKSAQSHYENGNRLFEEEKFQEAIVEYSKAIELDSNHYLAYEKRSESKEKIGDVKGAFDDMMKSIIIYPQNDEGLEFYFSVVSEKGSYLKAIKTLNKYIDQNKESSQAYFYRGTAKKETGAFHEALADFSKAIEMNGENIGAYGNRGNTYLALKEYDLALGDFNSVLMFEKDELAYFGKARAYFSQGKDAMAILELDEAINIDSTFYSAYQLRSSIKTLNGDLHGALIDVERCLENGHKSPHVYSLKGRILYELSDYKESVEFYKKALSMDETSYDTHLDIADAYLQLGEVDKACEHLEIAKLNNVQGAFDLYTRNCVE